MKFNKAVEKLKKSEVYKNWKKNHPEGYLVSSFVTADKEIGEWQIGFYSEKHDKITLFKIGKKITKDPEEDVLKKKQKVPKLNIKNIKVELDEILKKAELFQKKKYSQYPPVKKLIVVQNYDGKDVWNITYFTQSLKTLNMKFDASDGKLIDDGLIELFNFS